MKIGYRRLCGYIGLTEHESGTRGLWLEKRNALLKALRLRGNKIVLLNDPTQETKDAAQGWDTYDGRYYDKYDVLMIEFGGSNLAFYKKEVARTFHLLQRHKGKVIFICDDPDLLFPHVLNTKDMNLVKSAGLPLEFKVWQDTKNRYELVCDWSQWTNWFNSAIPEKEQRSQLYHGTGYYYTIPSVVGIHDAPFAALLKYNEPKPYVSGSQFETWPRGANATDDDFCYIGRPGGRRKYFDKLLQAVPLQCYGKPKEWDAYLPKGYERDILPAPPQARRSDFYSSQLACLAIADQKHTKLAWRTGRIYHALAAGCPAFLTPEHGRALALPTFKSTDFLLEAREEMRSAHNGSRQDIWAIALLSTQMDRTILENTFNASGL